MEKILEMRNASFLITVVGGEVVKCEYDGEAVFDFSKELSKEIDNDIAEHDRIDRRKFKVLKGGKSERD